MTNSVQCKCTDKVTISDKVLHDIFLIDCFCFGFVFMSKSSIYLSVLAEHLVLKLSTVFVFLL